MPTHIYQALAVAERNSESRPEAPIYGIVRETASDREQYPPLPADLSSLPSPKDRVRDTFATAPEVPSTNAPSKGSNVPNLTAAERAKKTTLAMVSKHGHNSKFSKKNLVEISQNFALDGSSICTPLYLSRPSTSGQRGPDISYCPKCHAPMRYRTTCDSPRCTSLYCAEKYGGEKGEIVADKVDLIRRFTPGAESQLFHVFISPPQEEALYWTQWGPHLEELYDMASMILKHGLGSCAYSLVAHTHRGRKKDRDHTEAARWLGLEEAQEDGAGPYWRAGFHFHALALVFNPRSFQYLKAVCRELYRLTGFIVHIKNIRDNPENVIKYQLSHAAIFTKEGAKRSMPAIRFYGNFAPTKIKKYALGLVIQGRKCGTDGEPLQVYAKGTPSTVHRKVWGYGPRYPKGTPNPTAEEVADILSTVTPSPYWDTMGRPITQKILTGGHLAQLLGVDGLYIPKRILPPLIYDSDPEEPDDYSSEDFPEITAQWIPPPEASSPADPKQEDGAEEPPPPEISPRIRRLGELYDLSELLEFCPNCRFITPGNTEAVADPIPISGPPPSGAGAGPPTSPEGREAEASESTQLHTDPKGRRPAASEEGASA